MATRNQVLIFGGGAALLLWLYSQTQAAQGGVSPFASLFGPTGGAGGPGSTGTPKPVGGGGGILADIGKAVAGVGTVLGLAAKAPALYQTATGLLTPSPAEALTAPPVSTPDASAITFGEKDVIQGMDTLLEKGGLLLTEPGVGASDIAGTIGGQPVSWGDIAANPELATAIAEGGTAVSSIAGTIGGQAVTWADIAANPELVYALAEGVGITGGAAAVEVGSIYAGVTATTLAELSGVTGAVAGTEVAGAGAASAGAAGAGLAAGLVAIPFLVLAAVNYVEQAKVAAQLSEEAGMVLPIFHALTDNGPAGAVAWMESAGGWAATGRGNSYFDVGLNVLKMIAFPNAKAENPWLTDKSAVYFEWAQASVNNAIAESDAVTIDHYYGQPTQEWWMRILRSGRYPVREDFLRIRVGDLVNPTYSNLTDYNAYAAELMAKGVSHDDAYNYAAVTFPPAGPDSTQQATWQMETGR